MAICKDEFALRYIFSVKSCLMLRCMFGSFKSKTNSVKHKTCGIKSSFYDRVPQTLRWKILKWCNNLRIYPNNMGLYLWSSFCAVLLFGLESPSLRRRWSCFRDIPEGMQWYQAPPEKSALLQS